MRPRRGLLSFVVLVTALGLLGPAPALAQSDPSISVSDTTPAPGQELTVTGSGFLPDSPVLLYLLPESTYPNATVGGDGTFRSTVAISRDSIDGAKQLVVRGLKADGTHSYLTVDLRVVGAPASARISDTELAPSARFELSGDRFKRGTKVLVVLFPERVLLAELTAASDQSIAADLALPEAVFDGDHTIIVAGSEARAGYAWIELHANVTGGIGRTPPVTGSGKELLDSFLAGTTTTSRATTTTRAVGEAINHDGGGGGGGITRPWILLVLLLLLAAVALVALVASWLRTPEGRRWKARRGWGTPA